MKAFALILVLHGLWTVPLLGQAHEQPDPDREAVEELIRQMGRDLAAGNLDAVESLFPSMRHILTDTLTLHGWDEYVDGPLAAELDSYRRFGLEHANVEADVCGDVAWVAFRQLVGADPSSGRPRISGRGTAVLERHDGRWGIVLLHLSR